jgi:hypothetical protein
VARNRRLISLAVLAILTIVPVTGMVCAMLCDPPAASGTASHHGPGHHPTEPASPSTAVQVLDSSEHDCCDHDAEAREVVQLAPERPDVGAVSASLPTTAVIPGALKALPDLKTRFDYGAHPGTAPPTTTLFVLRI